MNHVLHIVRYEKTVGADTVPGCVALGTPDRTLVCREIETKFRVATLTA